MLKSSGRGAPNSATGCGTSFLLLPKCPWNAADAGSKRWPQSPRSGPLAVEACLQRFPDARRVLDLGGGHGEYARAFAQRGLGVTLQDLEPTIELLKGGDLPNFGVELFAGDFFEALPAAEFDLGLCAGITHTYDGERNRLLYRRLTSILAPGGGLAIVTFLPERDPRALIFAVQMLAVSAGGNAHKESDYREWLKAEGYRKPEIQSLGNAPNHLLLAPR